MEKRNLKRAIAKFEELAADDEYEGNRKIINLDAFLKGDLKSKKKKQKDTADHLESTPIKCNKDERPDQLSNSFDDDQFEDSSVEIKTADQFLKQFLSQPSQATGDKMKKTAAGNRSAEKRAQSSKTSSTASKSATNSESSAGNQSKASNRSTGGRSLANKSVESKSIHNRSGKSNQSASRTQLSASKVKVQKDGDQKQREQEKQFLLLLQNRKNALEDEEYDEEEEEYDDEEEEFDDEIEDESGEEDEEDESLEEIDDESLDPESSALIEEQQLTRLRENQPAEFDDESIGDEKRRSSHDEEIDETPHHRKSEISNFRAYGQPSAKLYGERKSSDLVQYNVVKQLNNSRTLCRVSGNQSDYANHHQNLDDYVLNLDYQRSATEDLYDLILKNEERSEGVLNKLIKNIKRTLDQDELPEPSRVKPFFHFTSDNQIHATFLFINPNAVYYNPWDGIISTNYSDLSTLFEKIYDVIFSFDIVRKKRAVRGQA